MTFRQILITQRFRRATSLQRCVSRLCLFLHADELSAEVFDESHDS
jgi:hypothetical protein